MATKSLAKLKDEMLFNGGLTRLVDVMKGVATSQYFVMEHKRVPVDLYGKALEELFDFYDFRGVDHPYVQITSEKKLIVMIATDSGFLGGLNMKVMTAGLGLEDDDTKFAVLGERGANFMKELNKKADTFPGITPDDTRFDLHQQLISYILKAVWEENVGRVILVAPRATSFSSQKIEVLNLLPCPMFYRNKPEELPDPAKVAKNVILESKPEGIIEYLTLFWLRKRLIQVFEEAKLAEFGARTMHLEESFNTLKNLDKQLKLQFFKARREKIDQSLRETFTSQLVCKED
jgi:F-type H+-transporting ATPase subunit gamma